jgi:hypothetical protein
MTGLFRILAREYGTYIRSGPLRHAMLAYCAGNLPHGTQSQNILYKNHTQQACLLLHKRLSTPHVLRDTDVLATWILSLSTHFKHQAAEWLNHVRGAMSMSNHLSATQEDRSVSNLLVPFEFYFQYISNSGYIYGRLAYLLPNTSLPCQRPTFQQRLLYRKETQTIGRAHIDRHYEDVTLEALFDSMLDLVFLFLHCLRRMALNEMGVPCDIDLLIDETITYISNQLADLDLQQCLVEVAARVQQTGSTESTTIEYQLSVLILQLRRCIGFQISDLRSVLVFLTNSNTTAVVEEMLTAYRAFLTARPGHLRGDIYLRVGYVLSLVFAGLALSPNGTQERIPPCRRHLLISQDAKWLQEELEYTDYGWTSRRLGEFWSTDISAKSVANVLNALTGLDS